MFFAQIPLGIFLSEEISFIDRILNFFFEPDHPWRGVLVIFGTLFIALIYLIEKRTELKILFSPLKLAVSKIKKVSKKTDEDTSLENTFVNRPCDYFVEDEMVLDNLAQTILDNKLVCVQGLAGSGKTTIVRELCYDERLNHFDHKYEIDFESVNSPISGENETVEQAFNKAQKIFINKFNIDRHSHLEVFIKNTFKTPALLFIDNYEQITANSDLDSLIRNQLIQPFVNNPNFHIVVTSRDNVANFSPFELDELKNVPLSNIDIVQQISTGELTEQFSAIKLFFKYHNKHNRETRGGNRQDFTIEEKKTVVQLCHKVSNLPLGIMLLASRSVEIKVDEILQNLNESLKTNIPVSFSTTSQRQRNLYNAILWSYNLLEEDEQRFFAHLTFFENSTLLKNIPKWVNHQNQTETEKLITKLYKKSLINRTKDPFQGEDRYEAYYITREMFSEKMKQENISLNEEYCEAICRKCADRLNVIESLIFRPQPESINYKQIVMEVRLDMENILGFIEWTTKYRKNLAADILIRTERILNEIGPYLLLDNYFEPLLEYFDKGTNRARLLLAKARFMKSTEQRSSSETYLDEAIEILREGPINTLRGQAYSIGTYLYGELGKYEKRSQIIDEVSTYSDTQKKAISVLNLGLITLEEGRHYEKIGETELAINSFQRATDFLKGYNIQLGKALNYAALFFWRIGEAEKAKEYLFEAIYRYTDLGESRWILGFKTNLGLLFADTENLEEGTKYINEASKYLEKEGPYGWYQVNLLGQARLISRRAESEAEFQKAESLLNESHKNLRDINWSETITLCLTELAELYYNFGKYEDALVKCDEAIETCGKHNMSKSMRYFRSLTLKALCHYRMGQHSKVSVSKKEAKAVIESVQGEKWLSYNVCRKKWEELNRITHD